MYAMRDEKEGRFRWVELNVQSGYVTQVMLVPGGFLFRSIQIRDQREDPASSSMQFVPFPENKSSLYNELFNIIRKGDKCRKNSRGT